MGAKILSNKERDLGLPLMSKVVCTAGGIRRETTKEEKARAAFDPFVRKIEERAAMLVRHQGTLRTRVIDWQTFAVGIQHDTAIPGYPI